MSCIKIGVETSGETSIDSSCGINIGVENEGGCGIMIGVVDKMPLIDDEFPTELPPNSFGSHYTYWWNNGETRDEVVQIVLQYSIAWVAEPTRSWYGQFSETTYFISSWLPYINVAPHRPYEVNESDYQAPTTQIKYYGKSIATGEWVWYYEDLIIDIVY